MEGQMKKIRTFRENNVQNTLKVQKVWLYLEKFHWERMNSVKYQKVMLHKLGTSLLPYLSSHIFSVNDVINLN